MHLITDFYKHNSVNRWKSLESLYSNPRMAHCIISGKTYSSSKWDLFKLIQKPSGHLALDWYCVTEAWQDMQRENDTSSEQLSETICTSVLPGGGHILTQGELYSIMLSN